MGILGKPAGADGTAAELVLGKTGTKG
jgi:hypothetical protein